VSATDRPGREDRPESATDRALGRKVVPMSTSDRSQDAAAIATPYLAPRLRRRP